MALENIKVIVVIDKATALAAGCAQYGEAECELGPVIVGQLSPAARALLAERGNRFPINRITSSCDDSPANTVPLAAVPPTVDSWVALLEEVAGHVAARQVVEAQQAAERAVAAAAAVEVVFQAAIRLPYDAIQAAIRAEAGPQNIGPFGFLRALRAAGGSDDCTAEAARQHAGLQALFAQHQQAHADHSEAELAAARQRGEQAKLTHAANALREQALIDRIICRASEAHPALMLLERYRRGCLPADAVDALVRDWSFLAFDCAFAPFKRMGVKDVPHGFLDEGRTARCGVEAEAMEYCTVAALGSDHGLTAVGFVALTEAEQLVEAANSLEADTGLHWAVSARLHVATCRWCDKDAIRETLYVTCTLPTGRVLSREYAAEARP
jgi:hypothetical protein